MWRGNLWQGMTTSMTKRGIKSTPRFVKLSCSEILSAYSSGKFFCIMLLSVTLVKSQVSLYNVENSLYYNKWSKQQMKQKSNSRKNSLFSILTNMTWGPYQKNFLDSYWPNKIFQIPLHISLSSLTKSNINLDSMGPTSQTDTVMHKWLYLQTTPPRLNQWTAAPIQTIMFNSYSMGRIKIF